jgi:hypothetical protein
MTAPKLTKAQREALLFLAPRSWVNCGYGGSGTLRGFRFNGSTLRALLVRGLVEHAGALAWNSSNYRITDAGRAALKDGAK